MGEGRVRVWAEYKAYKDGKFRRFYV